jgi:hypothetical protein
MEAEKTMRVAPTWFREVADLVDRQVVGEVVHDPAVVAQAHAAALGGGIRGLADCRFSYVEIVTAR